MNAEGEKSIIDPETPRQSLYRSPDVADSNVEKTAAVPSK